MYEVINVGFDTVRLCLFVFIVVMLNFPLWLITIPPGQGPLGKSLDLALSIRRFIRRGSCTDSGSATRSFHHAPSFLRV